MDQEHPEHRPHGFSDTRYFYYALTGKVEGKCVTCGKPTEWNEETQKYNRFCNNPACKAKYKEAQDEISSLQLQYELREQLKKKYSRLETN